MGKPMKAPTPVEKPSAGRIVGGFLLTLIALPFLVFATCIPALGVQAVTGIPLLAIAVWVIGLLAFGIWRAVETQNPGVRWAIVVTIAASAIGAVLWFVPNITGIPR